MQFMEHSARRTKCPIFCVSNNLRQKAMLHGVTLQRVQDRRKALFSATATFLHSSVTLGNADSQQKVTKGHVANGEIEPALCGVEHKGVGFTELSFSAQAPPHQMFSPGCILASANPVWDSLIFLCQTTPSPRALKGREAFQASHRRNPILQECTLTGLPGGRQSPGAK